jgi:two-component system, cell cycle response regulator
MNARLLVIEDNAENMELLVYLLHASGNEVLTAVDGALGLEIAGREFPDLILCDIRMPVMDGFEVARRLKADPALRGIPVIAVTASVSGADRESAIAAGFDGFVAKPIEPEPFLEQIREWIAPRSGEASGLLEGGPA